jgi:serine/threonine-protein kinase HipA
MSLGVYWDGVEVGRLQPVDERSREYGFHYTDPSRPISLSLPTSRDTFTPAESRPFFEALLPEGALRDEIAGQLKLPSSDSYGLLAELGADCAGALQISEGRHLPDDPQTRWLNDGELDDLIRDLPRRPLGIRAEDKRMRLSLAGVQRKAVLVRDENGRFGEPLDGIPSTHILKPEPRDERYPGLAVNEHFCMLLAHRCGLNAAKVALITAAELPCLVVARFDRDRSSAPARRVHQEDLCQALGITPDFKYQQPGWRIPSYAALADLLDEHSREPGLDRLAAAQAAIFNFLLANADAHAKNVSILHSPDGVRLAPLYDVVCTGAYPELSQDLALAIGGEHEPDRVGAAEWSDLAYDLRLRASAFEHVREQLTVAVLGESVRLRDQAHIDGWHHDVIDTIIDLIVQRAERLR